MSIHPDLNWLRKDIDNLFEKIKLDLLLEINLSKLEEIQAKLQTYINVRTKKESTFLSSIKNTFDPELTKVSSLKLELEKFNQNKDSLDEPSKDKYLASFKDELRKACLEHKGIFELVIQQKSPSENLQFKT